MATSKGYVFISHSSKDIKKVREIRNAIEAENGNPILFYLKCLDDDSPLGEDEELLKRLISNEIKVRKKFLLCWSKNTEYGKSKYIDWEIDEVNRLKVLNPDIQIRKIDIENQSESSFVAEAKNFVVKYSRITIIGAYEDRELCCKIFSNLSEHGLDIFNACEDGETNYQLNTHPMWGIGRVDSAFDEILKELEGKEGRGIAIKINSQHSVNNIFVNKITYKLQHKGVFLLTINEADFINAINFEKSIKGLRKKIIDFIES